MGNCSCSKDTFNIDDGIKRKKVKLKDSVNAQSILTTNSSIYKSTLLNTYNIEGISLMEFLETKYQRKCKDDIDGFYNNWKQGIFY